MLRNMEFDARKLLEENLRLSKENNKLLRKMKSAATIGLIFRVLWIAILIGVPVTLYVYVIQPYYEGLREGVHQFQEQVGEIPGIGPFLNHGEDTGSGQ